MGRKVGVFGGTFDPIHLGHLILAETVRDARSLDVVLFIPAGVPPHKLGRKLSPAADRRMMVELAIAGHSSFEVSDVELRREGASYTVDTLKAIKEASPEDELFLILGADSLTELPTWKAPLEVIRLATVIVAARPGSPLVSASSLAPIPADLAQGWIDGRVDMPLIEISSTMIRQRRAAGRSIRYLVPAAVEAFLDSHSTVCEKPSSQASAPR